jgi:hypothetical protein
LTVESKNPVRSLSGKVRWDCVCDCSSRTTVTGNDLTSKHTTSCGCYHKERVIEANKASTTHGMTSTPEYQNWTSMIQRCTNKNNPDYSDYGGRGITVCDRWLSSFEAFYQDMGPKPTSDHSIDRRENDKGYYKDNCRWATKLEQANNRRNNVHYEYNGITKTVSEWSKEYGIEYNKFYARLIQYGWDFDRAVITP